MATKRKRYMISVDDELFEAIENYRFKNRIATRSEATARLLALGIEALQNEASHTEAKTNESHPH